MTKTMALWLSFALVVVTSPWTWQIAQTNWLIILLATAIAIWWHYHLHLHIPKLHQVNLPQLVYLGLLTLCIWQGYTARAIFLQQTIWTAPTPTEIHQQQQRYPAYPQWEVNLGGKKLTGSLAKFWELNPLMHSYSRLQTNLSAMLDLNYYFFAGHPRESFASNSSERIWFIWLPFWLIGISYIYKYFSQLKWQILWWVGLPLATGAILGTPELGPVALWPFMMVTITLGLHHAITNLKPYAKFVMLNLFQHPRILK